ncbi:MAG: enoyl-CoA hydratase/isomerase family protein, partial [Myxococcales bacterium]|nr:enoyl-CoA hydratase/isomerase family protein [Myxococcales bacterium]
RRGPIAELRLARPDLRNAMSPEMGEAIEAAVAELDAADDLRVVILSGEGKSFSAGGDFDLLERRCNSGGEHNRRAMRRFYASFLSLRELRVPTIAAIHGHAIGAGLCLAMACDLRVAAAGTKLGATFVRVGLHPGMGATYLLPQLIGRARATDLLLTGRVIDAATAEAMGLVSEVVAPEALRARVEERASEIAEGAPVPLAQLVATLRGGALRSLDDSLDREAACQAIDYATADMREAIAAFRDKRAPRFEGK